MTPAARLQTTMVFAATLLGPVIWVVASSSSAGESDVSQTLKPVAMEGPSDMRYMVTIDAGSSGSRIHVHSTKVTPGSGLPVIQAEFTHKVKPGLSSYTSDPAGAAKSIRTLLEFAMDHVPRWQWRRTPVFLKATAGLRSVAQAEAAEILEHCAESIERTAFVFKRTWASVISGRDEGMFGWVAANYLMQRLHDQANAHLGPVGVIEMGGASMQISFVPQGAADPKWTVPLEIGGRTYQLYTHSFLGYGLEQALERLEENLGAGAHNPCMPKGGQPQFPSLPGDFDKCSALMPDLLRSDAQCPAVSCSFNGVYQPSTKGVEFVAIENFFYTSRFFGVVQRPDQLDDVARPFCAKDVETMRNEFKNDDNPEQIVKRCFNAAYVHAVLTTGFGFSEPFENIKVVHEVNGIGIDWAIGSVLFETISNPSPLAPDTDTHRRPLMLPAPPAPDGWSFPFVNIWILVLPIVVVAAAFFLLRNVSSRRSRYAYTPLSKRNAFPLV
ncbi:Apyrase [Plasmodiophora brassicae]|uniref:Apyrase n=1 Tax=Plasmodiophora brassicae TaxID=37360 RepID=A0A0G4IKZ4_PLABS|nr:hypothetical protein PBRA_004475 [Plasmodiophora brassicae]SPR00017.1 unnamed protein product [Plasmodiophora brassicae]